MENGNIHLVTGGLGYIGKYIAAQLIADGRVVRTLTNSPKRPNPFGDKLDIRTYSFDDAGRMAESFEGVKVFYNTFWIRFEHGKVTFKWALDNTRRLVEAASAAGVERIVHISVLNCGGDTQLKYYRAKAQAEKMVLDSGMEYSILRPALVFGKEDILINNIAWSLRHLPVFGLFGGGKCRLRPIYVIDLASLAVSHGGKKGRILVDALGPEEVDLGGLVGHIKDCLGVKRLVMPVPKWLGMAVTGVLGIFLRDRFLTGDEVNALLEGRLTADGESAGSVRLRQWISDNADTLGKGYRSELERRRDRKGSY